MKITLEVPDNITAAYFCYLWSEDYDSYTMSIKPMNATMMKAGDVIKCYGTKPEGAGDIWVAHNGE